MDGREALVVGLSRRRAGRTFALTVDGPAGLPEAFLASTWLPDGMLWVPQTGFGFATAGVTKRIVVNGFDRIWQLRRDIAATYETLDVAVQTTAPPPLVRFFGGLSFVMGSANEVPWTEFGDGVFLLPRWTY